MSNPCDLVHLTLFAFQDFLIILFLYSGSGVPPGARFDPYGPPGVPGFEPDRFGRCKSYLSP